MMPPPQHANNLGYGNQQQYYSNVSPMMVNPQQSTSLIPQQSQPQMPQVQYPSPNLSVSTSQSGTIQPQQMPSSQVQYPQQQVPSSVHHSPMMQYTPSATVPQYLQSGQNYNEVSQSQTAAPTAKKTKLNRMQSQPIIRQPPQQTQQHYQQQHQQQLQYSNLYGSMQSIPSSSTAQYFPAPLVSMPQTKDIQLQQGWQNSMQYPYTDKNDFQQPYNYSNCPSQFEVPPLQQRQQKQQSLKRTQSVAFVSTSQYFQEEEQVHSQNPQYPPYYYPTNTVNYSNYHPHPIYPPQQQHVHQDQQQQQIQQHITPTSYYPQPQTSTPTQQTSQYSMMQNYQNPPTFIPSDLSPVTYSDTSGYQTASPDSILNYTNDSFNFPQ
uniref:Uncharacterized protein n=1 Tax=Panagrolaimus sp. ES5 TaxID=591445 RepID=A0AC34GCX6_9BILA